VNIYDKLLVKDISSSVSKHNTAVVL